MSQETGVPSGSRFPQTNTVYRCSNESCQKEKDKQTAKRVKLQQEKEDSAQLKIDTKIKEKAMQSKISTEESHV